MVCKKIMNGLQKIAKDQEWFAEIMDLSCAIEYNNGKTIVIPLFYHVGNTCNLKKRYRRICN